MRIKICGITRVKDALCAEAAGADAVGLIFAERSKRRVTLSTAAAISASLGPMISRVGVFVDAPLEAVERAVEAAGLNAVQLHGSEDAAYAARLRRRIPVIRAVSVGPDFEAGGWLAFPADALFLDGPMPGAGRRFDWSRALALKGYPRLILAGGLTASSVKEGIETLQPYAVDVASGVESSPGIKDVRLIQDFVRAARSL